MNITTRVKRLEVAAGTGVPCAECATCEPTPPGTDPRDIIAGTCGMCGALMHYRAVGWTERAREVGAVLATAHFGERWRDEWTAAAGWMDRCMREREQTHAQEIERLRPRAAFDFATKIAKKNPCPPRAAPCYCARHAWDGEGMGVPSLPSGDWPCRD